MEVIGSAGREVVFGGNVGWTVWKKHKLFKVDRIVTSGFRFRECLAEGLTGIPMLKNLVGVLVDNPIMW